MIAMCALAMWAAAARATQPPVEPPPVEPPPPAAQAAAKADPAELIRRNAQLAQQRADLKKQKAVVEKKAQALKKLQSKPNPNKRWICNAYGVEHDSPSECSDPDAGGRWITVGSSKAQDAVDRQLASAQADLDAAKKAYADANAAVDAQSKALASDVKALGPAEYREFAKQFSISKGQEIAAANAPAYAKRLDTDDALTKELAKSAKKYPLLTDDLLRTIVSVEAGADKNVKPRGQFVGLFQMGKQACEQVGADYNEVASDWKANAAAGTAYLNWNAKQLQKKGIEVTPLNLYLAHQQGPGGIAKLIKAVNNNTAASTPISKNQFGNLPPSMQTAFKGWGKQATLQDYYDYWNEHFKSVGAAVNPVP